MGDVNESEWMRRIDARLAEGNEIMRETREALDLNRTELEENRLFMHELLLRFDKAMERSDRRWQATLAKHERRWNETLNRYFGPNGRGPGSDPGPEPA